MSGYGDYEDHVMDPPRSAAPGLSDESRARAQHNALARKRRDDFRDVYSALREAVPEMNNERASRALILKKTIDAIDSRTKWIASITEETKKIEEENRALQEEIAELERGIQDTVTNNRLSPEVGTPKTAA